MERWFPYKKFHGTPSNEAMWCFMGNDPPEPFTAFIGEIKRADGLEMMLPHSHFIGSPKTKSMDSWWAPFPRDGGGGFWEFFAAEPMPLSDLSNKSLNTPHKKRNI